MGDIKYKLSESIAIFRTTRINSIDSKYVKTSEFSILIIINNSIDPIRAIDISKYINCSKVYASKIINILIKKDLILKIHSETDRRQYYLYSTNKGKKIVGEYMNKYMESTEYLFNKLGEEKSRKLIDLLNESTEILNNYKNK